MGTADYKARAALVMERTDELLATIGQAARVDAATGQVLMAVAATRLMSDPPVAAAVAGPLMGYLLLMTADIAAASMQSPEQVLAQYREIMIRGMEKTIRLLGEGSAPG